MDSIKNIIWELAVETEANLEELYDLELNKALNKFFEIVLEVQRKQTLLEGEWTTTSYSFILAVDGPAIIIDNDNVEVYWLPEEVVRPLSSKAILFLRKVEEYLEELV